MLQAALDAEMAGHLDYEKGERPPFPTGNHRNGTSPKKVLTEAGPIPLEAPRDRAREFGDIRDAIQNADPATKARIYSRLELRLTYQPAQHRVHAQANLNPRERGGMGSVRGPIDPIPPPNRLPVNADVWL